MKNNNQCETCSSIDTIQILAEYKCKKWWNFEDYHICKSCYLEYMKNCNWSFNGDLYEVTLKPKPFMNEKTHAFSFSMALENGNYIWDSFLNLY
jgi:hypothetical protein